MIEKKIEFYVHHFRRGRFIKRFSTTPQFEPYSVAEHSYFTAVLGWILSDLFPDVDRNKIVISCLFHDTLEVFTGDVIRPFKVFARNVNDELSTAEDELTSLIKKNFSINLNGLCLTIKERNIVKLADIVEAYCYTFEQVKMGNKYFSKFKIHLYLDTIKQMQRFTFSERKKLMSFFISLNKILDEVGESTNILLRWGGENE